MLKKVKEIPQINISISWKYERDFLSPLHKYRSTRGYLQAIRNRNPEILRSKEKECRCFDLQIDKLVKQMTTRSIHRVSSICMWELYSSLKHRYKKMFLYENAESTQVPLKYVILVTSGGIDKDHLLKETLRSTFSLLFHKSRQSTNQGCQWYPPSIVSYRLGFEQLLQQMYLEPAVNQIYTGQQCVISQKLDK